MSEILHAPTPSLAEIEAAARTDRNLAIDLAIKALGAGLDDPLVLRLVADGLEEDGRLQDAGNLLTRARAAAPLDVDVLTQFGRLLAKIGRPEEALAIYDEARTIDPSSYAAEVGAGGAHLTLGEVTGAKACFQRAHEIAPSVAEPLSALAVIAARQEDPKAARALAERALAIRADLPRAQMAIAQADLAEGAPALAEARLKWLLGRTDVPDDRRADAFSFLAEALDAQDRTAEAFFAYGACNALLAILYKPSFEANVSERWVDQARRLTAYFEAAPKEPWRGPAGDDREGAGTVRGHVFLMGFPRSGTTLLEQILASHPDVVAIEEEPLLSDAAGHMLADDAATDRLSVIGAEEADGLRGAYWRAVREAFSGEDISGKVFIDKLPLHTPALPLIAKLFPAAKIIFARRDPRDVVLSCYRRRFLLNAAMYEYLTLEDTARYYDETMRLAECYFAKLPFDIHFIRNEDLVADFEGVTRAALNYIGLDWDPAVWNFPARARALSNTPSAPQVARGLNAEGVGQWRRYQTQLSPVLPLLEPWAARFGYPPADAAALPRPADPRLAPMVSQVGAAVQSGDWARAFGLIDAAFAQGLPHPLFFRLRGVRAQQEGRLDAAIADFEAAVEGAPGDFATLNALGLALARNRRPVEGLARLDTAIAINPAFAPAHYNRGWTLEAMGDLAGAAAYRRAVELDPRHAQALGNLAVIAARAADWHEARRLAERALAIDPAQAVALTALAGAEAAAGGLAGAERRLRALLSENTRLTAHERGVALGALGDVLDRLDRPRDAFAAHEGAAALFRDLQGARFMESGAETSLTAAKRLAGYFSDAKGADWRRAPSPADPGPAKGHVFLLGFPRSGTTMLGQAMGGHPGAVTLDERDCLADAAAAFMTGPEGLGRLAAIVPTESDHYRDLYWRRVGAAGAEVAGKVFIDKQPMNLLGLPLIVKLFPNAKILHLRRDPRDVVLSAFTRRFAINATTVEFLSLAGAARLYDAAMRLMDIYAAKLDVEPRVQSYEALVEDFDGQTRAICDFVGLEWTVALADFAGRAGAVATPSGAQLARGLTAEGVGRWRRYRDDLAPVLPILAPWVARFGYPAD